MAEKNYGLRQRYLSLDFQVSGRLLVSNYLLGRWKVFTSRDSGGTVFARLSLRVSTS